MEKRKKCRQVVPNTLRANINEANYSAHAMVKSGKIGAIKGMVREIAIDALYLHIKPIFEIDDHVKVEIILLGAGSQLIINVPAIVTRQDKKGVAMRLSLPWNGGRCSPFSPCTT